MKVSMLFLEPHTPLKGRSALLVLMRLPSLLDEIRASRREFVQPYIELLLSLPDCLRILIEAIRDEDTCNHSRFHLQPNCLN